MKDFERTIIDELLSSSGISSLELSQQATKEIIDFSGAGYFLTLKDPALPKSRIVLDKPEIRGRLDGIDVGYLAFIENNEFTLECYSYDREVTKANREQGFERE